MGSLHVSIQFSEWYYLERDCWERRGDMLCMESRKSHSRGWI